MRSYQIVHWKKGGHKEVCEKKPVAYPQENGEPTYACPICLTNDEQERYSNA